MRLFLYSSSFAPNFLNLLKRLGTFFSLPFFKLTRDQHCQATGPMGGYMQQDAEECLSLVLDLINRRSPNNAIDALFGFDMEKK